MILAEQCENVQTGNPIADTIIILGFLAFGAWLFWLMFR